MKSFESGLGVSRIHANQLPIEDTEKIGDALLSALNKSAKWAFHLTAIHKPYLATTKFVDAVFDSGENRGARWLWYNVSFFRHSLCLLIDQMLSRPKRRALWWA